MFGYFCKNEFMAEELAIAQGTKIEQYELLLPQIKALIAAEKDTIATLSNVCAALKEQFSHLWIGFYLVKNDELVLGPFQGPIACTRIQKGKGVCGSSWAQAKTLVVSDVEKFPGHIACSSQSKSEIVVPILKNTHVVAVLDIDSIDLSTFDETDKLYLEDLAEAISTLF